MRKKIKYYQRPIQTPTIRANIQVTKVYRDIEKAVSDDKNEIIVCVGSARSTKTYSLSQFFLINRLLSSSVKNYKLLILRKIRHTLKLSTYQTFLEIAQRANVYDTFQHNKSDLILTAPNGNIVRFAGMDNISQLKSTGWNEVWLEETTDFDYKDILFLKTRLSEGGKVRLYFSLNPEECWIKDLEGQKGYCFLYSTYKDNPFLTEQYIDILKNLQTEDIDYYKIFALGQWAERRNLIYKHYEMIDSSSFPDDKSYEELIFGLDFGYINKTALIQIGLLNNKYYLKEQLYLSNLTNLELINKLKEIIPERLRHLPIYADSAEPARIKEISDSGFNIISADKNIKEGIDFCQRLKFVSSDENLNLNKEAKFYKWKTAKGNSADKETPVKWDDHLLDAKRYACYTHWKGSNNIIDVKLLDRDITNLPSMMTENQDW